MKTNDKEIIDTLTCLTQGRRVEWDELPQENGFQFFKATVGGYDFLVKYKQGNYRETGGSLTITPHDDEHTELTVYDISKLHRAITTTDTQRLRINVTKTLRGLLND